jgi:hypothetical protein
MIGQPPYELRRQNIERPGPCERFDEQQEDEQREMESIRQQLAEWVGRCRVCPMMGLPNAEHSMMRCPQEAGQRARVWAEEIKKQVKTWRREDGRKGYENYAAYFLCHVPQCICEKWEEDRSRGYRPTGQTCQYDQVVISILAQLIHGTHGSRDMAGMATSIGTVARRTRGHSRRGPVGAAFPATVWTTGGGAEWIGTRDELGQSMGGTGDWVLARVVYNFAMGSGQ